MANGRAGAPRSESARLAILQATAAVVDQQGYDAVAVEGIADRAGVGVQTIHRWYASTGAISVESLTEGS